MLSIVGGHTSGGPGAISSLMKKFPESEIQGEFFRRRGRKTQRIFGETFYSENLAKNFADFRPLISRKSGCKKFHEKSSTFSTRDETRVFHREIPGGGVPQHLS